MIRTINFLGFFLATQLVIGQSTNLLQLEVIPDFFQTPLEGNISEPRGVALNSKGHIFVFNTGNLKLMEFDEAGNFVRAIGQGLFGNPHGLRIDRSDNIWTTDLETHMVLKFSPEGRLLMAIGQKGVNGLKNEERGTPLFDRPADVAFGRDGAIFVADGYGNSRVVKLDKYGNWIKAWGEKGKEPGNFDNPHNIVVDHRDRVYVADRYNARIQVFDAEGIFLKEWQNVGRPWGLAMTPERVIYMTEGDQEKILKLDLEGNVIGEYTGGSGNVPGQFIGAHGIAVGAKDEIYVTSVFNWKVQKFVQHRKEGAWHRVLAHGNCTRRHESAFVEVDGKFVALGGRNTHKVDIYDPKTNTWVSGANSPVEMHHFQAIAYKGEVWVVGAFTGPYPKEEPLPFLYVYNLEKNAWRIGGKLPEGRHRGAAGLAVYQDKFYLLCGNQLGHYTGHNTWFDVFDPKTRTWAALPDAPNTRDHFQLAIIDDKLYAAGGRNTSQKTGNVMNQTIGAVDVYDFKTGNWTTLPESANLPTLRAGTTSVVLNEQLVVMGGESQTQVPAHAEVESYNPSTQTWKALQPMLQGRHGTQAIYHEGKVYIVSGSGDRGGGPELNTLDCWTPK